MTPQWFFLQTHTPHLTVIPESGEIIQAVSCQTSWYYPWVHLSLQKTDHGHRNMIIDYSRVSALMKAVTISFWLKNRTYTLSWHPWKHLQPCFYVSLHTSCFRTLILTFHTSSPRISTSWLLLLQVCHITPRSDTGRWELPWVSCNGQVFSVLYVLRQFVLVPACTTNTWWRKEVVVWQLLDKSLTVTPTLVGSLPSTSLKMDSCASSLLWPLNLFGAKSSRALRNSS